jgi:diacylglycerol kinase
MGISEELGHQNKMLDAMETDLDRTGEDLHTLTGRTKDLIAKSGGGSNLCIIVALTGIVLVLIFLILYS